MATCVRCGSAVVVGSRWCDSCLPVAGDPERPPLKLPGPAAMPVSVDGGALRVDDFPGALVPFVGDPHRSRSAGQVTALLSALFAVAMVLRAAPSLRVWQFARQSSFTTRDIERMVDSWLTANDLRPVAFVAMAVVALGFVQFERRRRPRADVRDRGEAFVEASLARVWPRSGRLAIVALGGLGLVGVLLPTDSGASFELTRWTFLAQALTSLSLAVAFGLVFRLVRASRRHLERRLAISAGLAPADAPFVAPDTSRVGHHDRSGSPPATGGATMFREDEQPSAPGDLPG